MNCAGCIYVLRWLYLCAALCLWVDYNWWMQHNFLSNYCLFYMTVQARECYRMLSVLSSMSVVRLPEKRL